MHHARTTMRNSFCKIGWNQMEGAGAVDVRLGRHNVSRAARSSVGARAQRRDRDDRDSRAQYADTR